MMFALPDWTIARLTSVNVRGEFHGETVLPQATLSFEVDRANDVLTQFDPMLKLALYRAKTTGAEPELEGVEPVTDSPALRFPPLGPLTWHEEGEGYSLAVQDGIDGHEPVMLDAVRINRLTLEPAEGGTVCIGFKAHTNGATSADQLGSLAACVQRDVRVRLQPPPTAEQASM